MNHATLSNQRINDAASPRPMNSLLNPPDVWRRAALIAFAVSILATAACSGNGPRSTLTDIAVATVDPSTSQDDGTSRDQSRRGGVLVIDTNDCGIFDPAIDLASDNLLPDLRLTSEIHAGLTRIGDAPDFADQPELAASFESRSGGTEWEFTLRPNLKFSDGSALTTADVKWSWERALRKATPPSRAHIVLGNIAGANQVATGASNELTGIRLIDDQRLAVELMDPAADFPTRIADPIASILNRENVSEWDDLWSNHETDPSTMLAPSKGIPSALPVGAGPFVLVAYGTPARISEGYSGDATCALQRNEHYWHPDLPYLDGIIANARPDFLAPGSDSVDRQLAALTGGSLDFAVLDANASASDAPEGTVLQVEPLSTWSRFLVFNPSVPPFDDINVRRALTHAVSVTRNANRFETEPTYGLIPPELLPGSAPVQLLQHDPTAATQAWQASEFANATSNPALERQLDIPRFVDPTLESVLDAWTDVLGIDVADIATQSDEESQRAAIKDIRYTYTLPYPIGILREAILSFGNDDASHEFAELRTMLDAAAAEPDTIKRTADLEALQQQLIDEAYILPLLLLKTGRVLATQPWVHDLQYPIFTGSAFRDVWFDETAPNRTLPTQ